MGVNTGKEMRAKIHKLSSEVSETKKYYSDKISSLKQREQAIRQRATLYQKMPLQNADKINKLKEEWTKVRAEIKQLTSEKDSKIQELGTQLEALKRDYRDNHEHYKQADKKVNSDKLKDIKIFISDHKFAIISAICVLAIAVIAGITGIIIDISSTVARPNDFIGLTINDAIKLAKQKGLKTDVWGSSYDPNAQDEQTVTYVSSVYFADGKQDYHYNKYTNGDMPLKSGYKISLETDDITKAQQTKIDECKSQGDRYHYRFKDGDLECYAEQTEEEKKAQCEAEGKWYRESQCKSQEEWETEYQWRAAHNACKKYGSNAYAKTLTDCYVGTDYKGTVDGKSEAENTENSESATVNEQPAQNQESESDNNSSDSGGGFFEQLFGNSGKKYRTRTIKDGESCPSDTQVCIISDKAYGYPTLNYGTYSGRVINNTPDDFSYIQVTANNYNASGIKIGDCIANSSGLNSGGTWAFEAYCSAWSEGGTIGDIDVSWW